MSTICDVNKTYDLTSLYGLPNTCGVTQIQEILLKALGNPDPNQRYAALARLNEITLTPKIKEKLLKLLSQEKDINVLSMLFQRCGDFKIKETFPLIIKRIINNPSLSFMASHTLKEISEPSNIPDLQKVFEISPSENIAIALLELGDPYPYYHNFLEGDLEIFNMSDTVVKYEKPPFWRQILDVGDKYPTKEVNDFALKERKQIVRKNIELLLNALIEKKDILNLLHFLATILKYPQCGISRASIFAGLLKIVQPKDYLFLIDELEKHLKNDVFQDSSKRSWIIQLVLDYFQVQAYNGMLHLDNQEEKFIKILHHLLAEEYFKDQAIHLLSLLGDESIIPYLLKDIKENLNCQKAIKNLLKLVSPGEYETEFKKVLESDKHSSTAKFYAALALAKAKKRDGLLLLLEELYNQITGFHSVTDPRELIDLFNTILEIIQPEDYSQIEKFVKSQNPLAVIIGLKLLAKAQNIESIPMILSLLDYKNVELDDKSVIIENTKLIKLLIKFKALLTLIHMRKLNDKETLEIVKKEIKFWESLLANGELSDEFYHLVQKFLPGLKSYVKQCELIILKQEIFR